LAFSIRNYLTIKNIPGAVLCPMQIFILSILIEICLLRRKPPGG
jgi:hypothetical protein